MNLVDSSGWLAYFADEENAEHFASAIEDSDHLVVSTINLYEVFKVLKRQSGKTEALSAIAYMQQGRIVEVTTTIALEAAKESERQGLPMADAIIFATAKLNNCMLWTQDKDFKDLDDVQYFPKSG